MLDLLDVHPTILDKPPPVSKKTDPVPALDAWETHALILCQTSIVFALQQAFVYFTGIQLGPIAAGVHYTIAFDFLVLREIKLFRTLAYVYSYLDGDVHPRDEIPDVGVNDIAGIPILAYLTLEAVGFHMGFYDWYLAQQYVVFVETGGHSGLRIHFPPPNPLHPILEYFGMELVLENHDLHHRKGWRSSFNYGKQSRVWDRIFGTCTDRIESIARSSNVDYKNKATMIWRSVGLQ